MLASAPQGLGLGGRQCRGPAGLGQGGRRGLVLLGACLVAWLASPTPLEAAPGPAGWGPTLAWPLAQQQAEAWPDDVPFERGGGFYFSPFKLAAVVLLFLCWIATTDWVNKDCLRLGLDCDAWNSGTLFSFLAAFLLMWIIPMFAIGFVLLLAAHVLPLFIYVTMRNARVAPHDKVLTSQHMRQWAGRAGVPVQPPPPADPELQLPPVKISAMGAATDRDNRVNLLRARQSPGYAAVLQIIADALAHRSDAAMIDVTAAGAAVRYQIDGIWHAAATRDLQTGQFALAVLKCLCARNIFETQARQDGSFGAEYRGTSYVCNFASQGMADGERALLQLDDNSPGFQSLDELGMRPRMQERLKHLLAQEQGLLLFSAPPQNGLSTTFGVAVGETDRYLRSFAAVQDAAFPDKPAQNVSVTTYDRTAGQTPATVLPRLLRSYPNALVVPELFDTATVGLLCEQPREGRLVLASIAARDAAEAMLRVLALGVAAGRFAPAVTAVLNQRLIRKLCERCKEAYVPPPGTLAQMGIPEGRVPALYRQRTLPPVEGEPPICPNCNGIGYRGRTAFFELLVVDEGVREALLQTPQLEAVRAAARAAGMATLQEEAVLLVAKGVTSLSEMLRVLKE